MTREIKFRAKIVMDVEPLALKKGDWVEGHYYEDLHQGEWCSWIQECDDITHYKVDKNTLGQFTGLLDKNGKEIYEGDIIFIQKCNRAVLHEIEYNVDNAMFVAKPQGWDFDFCKISQDWIDKYGKEVIGNVFDNSELLKNRSTMKRNEEIKKEAVFRYPEMTSRYISFIKGAKYADKTMLKKVCEYLEPPLTAFIGREDAKEFITAFRQAMEGE